MLDFVKFLNQVLAGFVCFVYETGSTGFGAGFRWLYRCLASQVE